MGGGNMDNFEVEALQNAASLADNLQYTSKPVAVYTHATNKEIYITATDTSAYTFTSVAHGLVNGNKVCPTLNWGSSCLYPPLVMQTPILIFGGVYYVVNATANTFQLSLTSGGAAIVLTTNATLDLTQWHFEQCPEQITISNLPAWKKYRVRVKGKSLQLGISYLQPNNLSVAQNAIASGSTAFNYPQININGSIWESFYVDINWEKILLMRVIGENYSNNTTGANTTGFVTKSWIFPSAQLTQDITSLVFYKANESSQAAFANGTIVEVYKY